MDTARAVTPPTPAARPARERRAPDIAVHDHGSIVLLRATSAAGQAWLAWWVSRDGVPPFPSGTRLVEPRCVPSIVDRATRAGLVVAARG
jgi:hypothetical protein